jgi:Ni,Fe-hydrogenase I large subunit
MTYLMSQNCDGVTMKRYIASITVLLLVSAPSMLVVGCTPTDEAATVAGLESAYSTLTQNRTLAEQFVRDIKSSVPATDPTYQQARESYEDAVGAYNRYLDQVEMSSGKARDLASAEGVESDAQSSVTDFLANATRTLQPGASTSRSLLRKAAPLPSNLDRALATVPRRQRQALIDKLDRQVRWRSWGEL